MAAIHNVGGARRAPRGVMRALSRIVVFGGLAFAGWLLGSGVGLASENPGQPDTGLTQLVGDPASPTVASAVTSARSAVWVPSRSVPPPVRFGVLRPIVNTVGAAKPLTRVLAPQALAALSRPAAHGGIRPHASAGELAAVPPAEPATRAAVAMAPALTLVSSVGGPSVRPAARRTTPDHGRVADADPFAGRVALGTEPAAPVPASPAGSSTSVGVLGGTASGAGTKSSPYIAVSAGWASVGPAPAHRLSYLGAGDLPRSPAVQPSTSPD